MIKKTILFLASALMCSLFLFHTPTLAAGTDCSKISDSAAYDACMKNKNNYDSTKKADTSGSVFKGSCRDNFLGFTSWDCGVNIANEDSLKSGIWQIAANIATDITVIAAYLVLGYVIYGGYLYIFSSGEASKVASGKKTLVHAFIGLAIVMSAYLIMSTIRFALMGENGAFNCDFMSETGSNCVDANTVVTSAISWAIGIAGAVALIFVVYGGITYATSAGEPTKLAKAKQAIIYALIGLTIVAIAEIITAFVSGMIRDANNKAGYTHQTIISKETHEINNA